MAISPLSARLRAMFTAGAIGDAFGAPIEILKRSEILDKFGPAGLTYMAPYDAGWLDADTGGVGTITDDTTMLAVTLDALSQTKRGDSEGAVTHRLWQAYLRWGSLQLGADGMAQFIDGSYIPHPDTEAFLFRCGAGGGTIAALLEGRPGTLDQPLVYNRVVKGKRQMGPNRGCGGMMRAAAFAPAPSASQAFDAACANAAITHGHPEALAASGAMAHLLAHLLQGQDLHTALKWTEGHVKNKPGGAALVHAFHAAVRAAQTAPMQADRQDTMPPQTGLTPFLAVPVWAQTVYTLASVAMTQLPPTPESFKKAMIVAANHSGDSDSVAALVGQALGAAWGDRAIPQDWKAQIPLMPDWSRLVERVIKAPSVAGHTP